MLNFNRLIVSVLIGALVIVLNSCECVPDINTTQKITPTSFAKVLYINSLLDVDDASYYGNDFNLGNFNRLDSVGLYVESEAGLNYLRVKNNGGASLVFAPCDFDVDSYYTTCTYGYGAAARVAVFKDPIENISLMKPYIRLINLSFTFQDIKLEVLVGNSTVADTTLSFLNSSDFFALPSGSTSIKLSDNSDGKELGIYSDILTKNGTATNVIIADVKDQADTISVRYIYCNLQNK